MSDPLPAPTFGAAYTTPLTDIGSGYAAGITSAGKSIAEAIGSVSDIAKQNLDTNDMLTAMHQTGILGPDEYNAVMGKSLGAKQTMLGMYAGQWIADQASKRAVGQASGIEVAKIQAQIDAIRKGYGRLVGYDPAKLPVQPAGKQPAVQAAAPIQNAQPLTEGQKLAGVPGQPTPLGSGDIYNPLAVDLTMGKPLGPKEPIPVGSKIVTLKTTGQRGYLMSDGITFRPRP